MIRRTLQILLGALLCIALTAFISGCKCCAKKSKCAGPVFQVQPESQIVLKGSTLVLTALAHNPASDQSDPVDYQWYLNYAPIAGATSSTLKIESVKPSDAGRYFVIASGYGSSKSCDADILVNDRHASPTGNGGTLFIGTSSFSSGGASCFSNPPWDKNYPITTGNFVGPSAPGNTTQPFPNTFQSSTVTIDTCATANGTTLETGIVIVEALHPLTDKVCSTNAGAACQVSGLLTINQRSVTGSNKYKATIVYKNSTATGLTNIAINWHYP